MYKQSCAVKKGLAYFPRIILMFSLFFLIGYKFEFAC